jgi:hypothetical protein
MKNQMLKMVREKVHIALIAAKIPKVHPTREGF